MGKRPCITVSNDIEFMCDIIVWSKGEGGREWVGGRLARRLVDHI